MTATYIKFHTPNTEAFSLLGANHEDAVAFDGESPFGTAYAAYFNEQSYEKVLSAVLKNTTEPILSGTSKYFSIDLTPEIHGDHSEIYLDENIYKRCQQDIQALSKLDRGTLDSLDWAPEELIGQDKIFIFKEGDKFKAEKTDDSGFVSLPEVFSSYENQDVNPEFMDFVHTQYPANATHEYVLMKTRLITETFGRKRKEVVPVLIKVKKTDSFLNQNLSKLKEFFLNQYSKTGSYQDHISFILKYSELDKNQQKIFVEHLLDATLDTAMTHLIEEGNPAMAQNLYHLAKPFAADNTFLVIKLNKIEVLLQAASNLALVSILKSQNSALGLNVGREIYDKLAEVISKKEHDSIFAALNWLTKDDKYSIAAKTILGNDVARSSILAHRKWPHDAKKVQHLLDTVYKKELDDETFLEPAYLLYDLVAHFSSDIELASKASQTAISIQNSEFSYVMSKWWDSTEWWEIALTGLSIGGAALRLGTLGLGLASRFSSFSSLAGLRTCIPGLSASGLRFLSNYKVAGTLLAADSYMLAKHAPQMLNQGYELLRHIQNGNYRQAIKNATSLGLYLLGIFGLGVGYNAFRVGIIKGLQSFRNSPLSHPDALNNAFIRGDTWRRLMEDPQFWSYYARGSSQLSAFQKSVYSFFGRSWDFMAIKGALSLGILNFLNALGTLQDKKDVSTFDIASIMAVFAMDVVPATGTLLYRAGRGSRHFNMGPVPSQENPVWDNKHIRDMIDSRLEKAIPRISKAEEAKYLAGARADLSRITELLRQARKLTPLEFKSQPSRIDPAARAKTPKSLPPRSTWDHRPHDLAKLLADFDVHDLHHLFKSGELTPLELLQTIIKTHDTKDSTLFARGLLNGPLARKLKRLAVESTKRYKAGTPKSIYDGIPIPSKDLKPDLNGKMQVGSKSAFIEGIDLADMTRRMLDLGAIPLPVGMVAGANGGSGANNGWGYTPNPKFIGKDPAGSSSVSAYMVGREILPLAEGTDTGGSIKAPAGACDIVGFVPPKDYISRDNLVPFAQHLDHVGVFAKTVRDALDFARALSPIKLVHGETQSHKPTIVYSPDLLSKVSATARNDFLKNMEQLQSKGYELIALPKNWDFIFEVPMLLYPYDAYPHAAYNHFNPHQKNPLGEAPRYTLDDNLNIRFRRAALYLKNGVFDEAMKLHQELQKIFKQKFGTAGGFVIASPAAEAIDTTHIIKGCAGADLDNHDLITMLQNRIDELATLVTSSKQHGGKRGLTLTGQMPALNTMAFDLFF